MSEKEKMLSHKRVKSLLKFYPDTGKFIWRTSPSRNITAGCVAGCSTGKYQIIKINRKIYYAHRLAWFYMTGKWPENQIDHINHNGLDNRWSNLRSVSHINNSKNQSKYCTNSSGVSGIYWNKQNKKWHARISDNTKRIHLGYFHKKKDAISARENAKLELSYHKNHGGC